MSYSLMKRFEIKTVQWSDKTTVKSAYYVFIEVVSINIYIYIYITRS